VIGMKVKNIFVEITKTVLVDTEAKDKTFIIEFNFSKTSEKENFKLLGVYIKPPNGREVFISKTELKALLTALDELSYEEEIKNLKKQEV